MTLFGAPSLLLFRCEHGEHLCARLLGYVLDLLCLLVGREGLVLLNILLLFLGVVADRLDFVFLILRKIQRVVVFDGVRIL
jgi:hypothetical protein